MANQQLPGLNPSIAYRLGSFEEWGARKYRDTVDEYLKASNFNWLHDLYQDEFNKQMHKLQPLDEESVDAVKLVVKSAIRDSQKPESYIGDVYNVELPASMKWYAEMTGRGIFTNYAWMSNDTVLPLLLEKYSTAAYPPYEKWRADEIWRITGDGWQLTFGGNHTTWTYHPGESTNGCVRILDYDSPDYQEYCQFKHRIDTVICPRLIGDEEMFLNDLCLLRLL